MVKALRPLLAMVISVLALIETVRLVAPADTPSSVRRQLVHLRQELDGGAATRAQESLPEGNFFLYALYGLTSSSPPAASLRDARWALTKLENDEGRAPFSASLTPA